MIVWAAIGIIMGLALLFFPAQLSDSMGFGKLTDTSLYLGVNLGVLLIVTSVFIIVAARDPLKHIRWVQAATVMAILDAAIKAYSTMRGFVTFSHVEMGLIIDVIFAVALLALYPWRAGRTSQ
jgi:hypothetical protein